jgi:hypothetical protein
VTRGEEQAQNMAEEEATSRRDQSEPAEAAYWVALRRYGFAFVQIAGAPPVILVDPERVLMAVLK